MPAPLLTLQDKLALAITSAGSQRKLAAAMGISHQKLGRWLREGESGGIKQIPKDAKPLIDAAFNLHKEITRDQARVDQIPYFPQVPVYAYRPLLKTGKKGERLVAPHTEFIQQDLRMLYLAHAHHSGKFWGVSIRSVIDWYVYVTNQKRTTRDKYMMVGDRLIYIPTGEVIEQSIKPVNTKKEGFAPGTSMEDAIAGVEEKLAVQIDKATPEIIKRTTKKIATESEDFRRSTSIAKAINSIEEKLRGKHERNAVRFADEYLLQLLPEDYNENEQRIDRPSRATPAKKGRARKSYQNRKG